MTTYVRINKENGVTIDTTVTCKEDMDKLIVLVQKFNWTYDIIGRRPW